MARRLPLAPGNEGTGTSSRGHDNVLVELPARPRKQPRQARSVALVEALKTAGREILEREGREALSIYRLSDYSGVAISSIYEYFPTIDSLIGAIFEDYRADVRQQVIAGIHALPESATLYDGIEMILRHGLAALHRWLQVDSELSIKSAYYGELVPWKSSSRSVSGFPWSFRHWCSAFPSRSWCVTARKPAFLPTRL